MRERGENKKKIRKLRKKKDLSYDIWRMISILEFLLSAEVKEHIEITP